LPFGNRGGASATISLGGGGGTFAFKAGDGFEGSFFSNAGGSGYLGGVAVSAGLGGGGGPELAALEDVRDLDGAAGGSESFPALENAGGTLNLGGGDGVF
jgi:hypothetical protein